MSVATLTLSAGIASHMPESPPPAHQEALGSPSAGSALGYFHAVVLRTPALTATSNEPLSVRRVSTAGYVALGQCSCPADVCSSSFSPHQVELTLLCPRTMVKSPSFLFWMKRGSEESSGLREEEQAVRGTSFRVSAHSLGFGGVGRGPCAPILSPPLLLLFSQPAAPPEAQTGTRSGPGVLGM